MSNDYLSPKNTKLHRMTVSSNAKEPFGERSRKFSAICILLQNKKYFINWLHLKVQQFCKIPQYFFWVYVMRIKDGWLLVNFALLFCPDSISQVVHSRLPDFQVADLRNSSPKDVVDAWFQGILENLKKYPLKASKKTNSLYDSGNGQS